MKASRGAPLFPRKGAKSKSSHKVSNHIVVKAHRKLCLLIYAHTHVSCTKVIHIARFDVDTPLCSDFYALKNFDRSLNRVHRYLQSVRRVRVGDIIININLFVNNKSYESNLQSKH